MVNLLLVEDTFQTDYQLVLMISNHKLIGLKKFAMILDAKELDVKFLLDNKINADPAGLMVQLLPLKCTISLLVELWLSLLPKTWLIAAPMIYAKDAMVVMLFVDSNAPNKMV